MAERKKTNYDHPDAMETELLIHHLEALKAGKAIDCPTYDFTRYTRAKETMHIEPKRVILLEGILVLANEQLRDLMDIKIYVEADADERILRRIIRDVKERGRDIEGVAEQYLTTVKPMHYQYVDPTRSMADIVINSGMNPVAFELVRNTIQMALTMPAGHKEGEPRMENKDFLGKEPIGKLLFRLALPTVTAQMINMLYNIVDRMYIGHIPNEGSLALTGVGVCMPLILIVAAFASIVSSGGAPRASISMGKGDKESAEKTLGNCFMMQIIVAAVLTVMLLAFNRQLLMAFGASSKTIEYGVAYMNIYAVGTIFVQLTLGMNTFITAQGFAKIGMFSVLIGAVANILFLTRFLFSE